MGKKGGRDISRKLRKRLYQCQRDELTGAAVYGFMARRERSNEENRRILESMAAQEIEHAAVWQGYTGKKARAHKGRVLWLKLMTVLLGYTFVLRLLQKDESLAQEEYDALKAECGEDAVRIFDEEHEHEQMLISLLDEERLQYIGAMVLGLNDALVELTGTIAGLTFALGDTRLVALSGIITGVSATFSMAASNYLAERANNNPKALKSSLFTGVAYLITVALLVLPYLILPQTMAVWALAAMLAVVILIIVVFNYYIAVARNESFWKRFGEMAVISLSVAAIAFVIGLLVKHFLGIDV